MTVFTNSPRYPELTDENRIDVEEFVAASEILPKFLDRLGCFPDLVKNDVKGNIKKMRDALQRDGYKYIKERLEKDQIAGIQLKCDSSTMALLWLRRALLFMWHLMNGIVEEHQIKKLPDSLRGAAYDAYALSLEKHHNLIARGIFKTVIRFVPARTAALQSLSDGASIDQVVEDMKEMLARLWPLLTTIRVYYISIDEEHYTKEFRGEECQGQG